MQQITLSDWKKFHRFQEKQGWCGPAVIQMTLEASGITKSQKEIAKDVYLEWWGTTGTILLAYLSRFFGQVNYKNNSTLPDLLSHLSHGHIVIVNWWDDVDKGDVPGGHYSIAGDYKNGILTLVDPSNSRKGIWTIPDKEFEKRWYDFVDVNNKVKIEGFLLWVDSASKI